MIKPTKEIAELTGMMFGDGCLSKYSRYHIVYICGHKIDDYDYHDKITRFLFKKIFNKEIRIEKRKDENTLIIRFNSKLIFDELHSLGIPIGEKYSKMHIPEWIKNKKEFLFAFIRGVIDTDGSIVFSKQHRKIAYYPRIEIASKSKEFLVELFELLINNGFYGSISKKKDIFRLEIPGFKNLRLWLTLIGFSNPKNIRKTKNKSAPDQKFGTKKIL